MVARLRRDTCTHPFRSARERSCRRPNPALAGPPGALADASDAYRTCASPASDARNRRWIAERMAGIEQIEAPLAARLVELYQTHWSPLPIRTDVMYFGSGTGADWRPDHIRISSTDPSNGGWSGVEVAFQQGVTSS